MNELELMYSEARANLAKYITQINKTNQVIKVIRRSKTEAFILSPKVYYKLKEDR